MGGDLNVASRELRESFLDAVLTRAVLQSAHRGATLQATDQRHDDLAQLSPSARRHRARTSIADHLALAAPGTLARACDGHGAPRPRLMKRSPKPSSATRTRVG